MQQAVHTEKRYQNRIRCTELLNLASCQLVCHSGAGLTSIINSMIWQAAMDATGHQKSTYRIHDYLRI